MSACNRGPCSADLGHDGTCEEASGWITTCDDLGCVDGRTVQGRKYHYDGSVEEQWAPCGRMASNCPPATHRNPLEAHRICNADYGRVACYCSALDWMTLDQYGEHIEAIAAERYVERHTAHTPDASTAHVLPDERGPR